MSCAPGAGGETYLTSTAQSLTWVQLNMVDVYAALFVAAAVLLSPLGWVLWALTVRMRRLLGHRRANKVKAA